jgi:nucleoside-diphosphate-sugar epimerase
MKILLTGHRGFIGTALLTQLTNRNDVEVIHCIDLQSGENLLTCDTPSGSFGRSRESSRP